jgi:hypothetical protein
MRTVNNGLSRRLNKCCFDPKNTVTVTEGWSHICGVCGRYTYDYDGCQLTVPGSIDTLGKKKYYSFLDKARIKVQKLKAPEQLSSIVSGSL